MHRRILFGVAAWLLGAATATAGSLLAVSLLGQGITGGSGPLLSQVAVDRALARESTEPAAEPTASAGGSLGADTAGASRTAAPSGSAAPSATGPSAGESPSEAPPSGTASATASATQADGTQAGGTVLTSHGGDAVASCQAGGAYLDSWSPAQGFAVDGVLRGPAQVARVTFVPATGSDDSDVTMLVSCSAGIPSATTRGWQPGDN